MSQEPSFALGPEVSVDDGFTKIVEVESALCDIPAACAAFIALAMSRIINKPAPASMYKGGSSFFNPSRNSSNGGPYGTGKTINTSPESVFPASTGPTISGFQPTISSIFETLKKACRAT